jgi:hypothetical protein
MATRPHGIVARQFILDALLANDGVELDFENSSPTPSFADECIGVLASTLGLGTFKSRVRLANVPEPSKILIKHVVLRRTREIVSA